MAKNTKQSPPKSPKKAAPAKGKGGDVLKKVLVRRDFLRDGARSMRILALGSLAAAVFALVVLTVSINKKSSNRYIATMPDGQLIQVAPLEYPNHSETVVKNWLGRAMSETFEMDFVNYKSQINRAVNQYFTRSGGAELISSLQESGFLDQVKGGNYAVSLVSFSDPVLVRHGNFSREGYYAWLFQARSTLTFQSQDRRFDLPVDMTITVTRRDTLEYPMGLGIARIFIEMQR